MNIYRIALLFVVLLINITISAQTSLNQLLAEEDYNTIIKQLEPIRENLKKDQSLALAIAYKKVGNPDKTIELLLNNSDSNSFNEEILLSSTYFHTGNYKAAKPICEALYQQTPDNIPNLMRLVEIHEFYDDTQLALKALLAYEAIDTTNFEVNKQLAKLYQKTDSTDKAISTYHRILNQYPDNQTIGILLGKYLFAKKRYPECNEICMKFLETDPHHRRFLLLGGLANFEAGTHKNTLTYFNRLENQGDSSYLTKKHLGITYYRLENIEKAVQYLRAAYNLKAEDPKINYYLGAALSQTNQPQEGIPYLLDAIDLLSPAPANMEKIFQKLATINYDIGNYSESLKYYAEAHSYAPQTAQYIYHQAAIYDHNLVNMQKAKELYQKFIDELPEELDPKKGNERYAIQLKKVVERRLLEIDEELFFQQGSKK